MAGIAPHYLGFDYRNRLPFGLALESLTKLHAMPVSAVFFSKFFCQTSLRRFSSPAWFLGQAQHFLFGNADKIDIEVPGEGADGLIRFRFRWGQALSGTQ